jgi:hypothetical protein
MGLKDLKEGNVDTSSSSSKGGSDDDSDSGSSYPKYDSRVPYFAIWQEEDGTYHSGHRPENLIIEYEKSSKSASWELHAIPAEMERHWMDRLEVKRVEQMVEEELCKDLRELLDDDPEQALKAITEAAKSESPKQRPSRTRPCGVCGDDIDFIGGDYEQVNGKRVCSNHTVQDIAEAGLLDD